MNPDASPREVACLFRRAGVAQFALAVPGALKGVLEGERRRPVFPMFTRTVAQMMMMIRATVEYGLSTEERWTDCQSCEVDDCMRRVNCVDEKQRLFGCSSCKRRLLLAIRGTVHAGLVQSRVRLDASFPPWW